MVKRLGSKQVRSLKSNLFKTCPAECYICNIPLHLYNCTLDHLIAKSLGGTNIIKNTAIACATCNNNKKSDLDNHQINYIINRIGFVPNSVEEFVDVLRDQNMIVENFDFTQLMTKLIYFFYTEQNKKITVKYQSVSNNSYITSPQITPAKSKSISPLTKKLFLQTVKGTHQCAICSDTNNLNPTKIIRNNFGGSRKLNNVWLLCDYCANFNSNSFEKFTINYILNRDFAGHKEWIPTSIEDIISYLEFTDVIRENITITEKQNLIIAMREMYSNNLFWAKI